MARELLHIRASNLVATPRLVTRDPVQTAEAKESMVSSVSLPAPPQTGAFSSKAAAARMAAVLDRSGASRDDMVAIVRQIKQLEG